MWFTICSKRKSRQFILNKTASNKTLNFYGFFLYLDKIILFIPFLLHLIPVFKKTYLILIYLKNANKFVFQLRQEKCRLEQTLEQEQECLVNKLMRKIEKLEAETLAKQMNLERLRREKVMLVILTYFASHCLGLYIHLGTSARKDVHVYIMADFYSCQKNDILT